MVKFSDFVIPILNDNRMFATAMVNLNVAIINNKVEASDEQPLQFQVPNSRYSLHPSVFRRYKCALFPLLISA